MATTLLLVDMLIVVFAYFVTPVIVDGIDNAIKMVASHYTTILISMLVFVAVLYTARVYTVLWIHASVKDYARILYAGLVASVFVLMINNVMVQFKYTSYGPRQTICAVFIILVFMLFSRMLTYALYSVYRERQHTYLRDIQSLTG